MKPEEKEVLAKNNVRSSYEYCLKNKEANVSLHEDIIIKSNNAVYIYFFARDIKNANIDKLEDAIIESNDPYYIYLFANDVQGANLTKLEDAIIKSDDASFIYRFAKYTKGVNIAKLEDAIIKSDDIGFIFYFSSLKNANLDKFKDILENSEYKEIFARFYEEYKKNKMTKEEQEVIAKNDPKASYDYCLRNKDANISLHEDIIIKSNDTYYIYWFAINIENANIAKLEDAIIKSNNVYFIYHFARDVKGANLDKFKDILEKSEYKEEFKVLYNNWEKNKLKDNNNVKANSNSSSNFDSEKSESAINNNSTKQFKKENNKMSNSMDFFKINLIEGAYAGTAVVAVDNIKKAILAAAKSAGADEMSLAIASTFLDAPAGKAILSILVGSGVKFIPVDIVQSNPHLQKVAEKCIQNAGSEGAQYAFNLATTFILPALLNAIQSNPQISLLEGMNSADKLRVSTPANNQQVSEEDNSNVVEGAFNKASRASLK